MRSFGRSLEYDDSAEAQALNAAPRSYKGN